MKLFNAFLNEKDENPAHAKARAMGLKYRGFGYWANPATGQVEYKTRDGELIPIEGGLEVDGGGAQADPAAAGGGAGDIAPAAAPAMGDGSGIGPAEDPGTDGSWQPGPDGDTDVGRGEDVPDDVFVPKTNDPEWTAGPDGTNMSNWSFDQLVSEMKMISEGLAAQKAEKLGLVHIGSGRYANQSGEVVARAERGDLRLLDRQEKAAENEKGGASMGPDDRPVPAEKQGSLDIQAAPVKGGVVAAAQGLGDAAQQKPVPMRQTMVDRLRVGNYGDDYDKRDLIDFANEQGSKDRDAIFKDLEKTLKTSYDKGEQGEYTKALGAEKKMRTAVSTFKDRKKVEALNKDVVNYVEDPDFDMDDTEKMYEIASGAFGTVYDAMDGATVVKEGEIGEEEMKALYLLGDNDQFPALVNARFTSPFAHQSSRKNNPFNDEDDRADVEGNYFDPDDATEFEEMFPTATGKFAMSKADGQQLADIQYDYDEEGDSMRAFKMSALKARMDMHLKGISHNDMHAGNIIINEEEERASIIDLGLAKVNSLSALLEGIGGVTGEDYQLASVLMNERLDDTLPEYMEKMRENLETLKETFLTDWYEEDINAGNISEDDVLDFFEGGIRLKQHELDRFQEAFEFDEDDLEEALGILYDGIEEILNDEEDDSTAGRMSRAYDKLVQDFNKDGAAGDKKGQAAIDMIKVANGLRKLRGEKSINVKGLDIDKSK